MEYNALWAQTNGYITLRVYRIYNNIAGEHRYLVRIFGAGIYIGYPIYNGSSIYEAGSLEDAKHWSLSFLESNTASHAATRLAEFENSSQV